VNCRWVENRLAAYADAELGGEEMLRVRRHLSQCAACDRLHSEHLAIKRIGNVIPLAEPPAHLLGGIFVRLDAEQFSGAQRLIAQFLEKLRWSGLESAFAWRRAVMGAAAILVAFVATSSLLLPKESVTSRESAVDSGLDFADTQHTFYQSSQPLGMEAGFVLMERATANEGMPTGPQPAAMSDLGESR